ncbi:MAG: HpcH/HpaI aldolase/citrate lyase family protein [Desulfotomaculales bacterium]
MVFKDKEKPFRSILFTPGSDPAKIRKAFATEADAVALDLEDAVAPERKNTARENIKEFLSGFFPTLPFFIRVNNVFSSDILKDLQTIAGLPAAGIMLPKVESGEEVRYVDWLLTLLDKERETTPGHLRIIPFVESALGLERAEEIARSTRRVLCLAFGGNDYTADIGTSYSSRGNEMFYARCRLVVASRAAGILPPLDTVNPDFQDLPSLAEEAREAKRLGFQGKLVIHPAQVAPVNEAFTPSQEEVAWAKKVIETFNRAQAAGNGVTQMEGKMVELPVVRRARQILSLANEEGNP